MEFFYQDFVSLLQQTNFQEKELRNKRRWLIGLPTSVSEAEKEEGSNFHIQRPIPEKLLREDDVSYEIMKSLIEKGAGVCTAKNKYHVQDDMQLIYSPVDATGLLSIIDDMTNQGLERFANVLTGGSIKIEKTRWKMKQIIKERLSEVLLNTGRVKLSENQFSILKNPHNFHWSSESRFIPDSDSYHVAVHKILNLLEDLPTQTLSAMHRKLKGTKGYMPQLIPKKSGWGRDALIKRLRKACLGLLLKLNEEDSLPEPLAKAMEVAALNLKLIEGCHYVTNFRQFSSEVNALQSEIATSIQLIDQSLKLSVLKDIQVLLDPKAKLSDRSLRASVRNLLTDYLFECGDMDTVPQCLREMLSIIRKNFKDSNKCLAKTKIEEDIECILSVSACMKQVMWDLIPEHDLDLDLEFADAYVEDLEDSDGDYFEQEECKENNMPDSSNSDEEVVNAGDNFNSVENSTESRASIFSEVNSSQRTHSVRYHLVSLRNTEEKDADSVHGTNDGNDFPPSSPDRLSTTSVEGEGPTHISERNSMFGDQSMSKNQYLAVQGASDEASMVAYRLIGRMLSDFAQIEGCEVNSGDMSYLGVGSYDLKQKKRRAKKKSATHKEDGSSITTKEL